MGSLISAAASPLYWAEGWPRTSPYARKSSRYEASFVRARDDLSRQLKLLGAVESVISTNVPLRKDMLPLANMSEPSDPGVAVYWIEREWKLGKGINYQRVMACDCWRTVRENLRAVGKSVEALRTLKRAGATQILERAYLGFAALPENARRQWRTVLGFSEHERPDASAIEQAFRLRLHKAHPDKGGTDSALIELTRAREEALEWVLDEMKY